MTNIEKLYIKKLKEYIIKVDYIIGNHEMSNMILTRIRRQIASLEKQMIEEQKTISDEKEELFHLCQYSEGVCVWCGHIMGIDDEGRIDPEADKQAFGSGWENIK